MRSTCDRLLPPAWREVALVIVLVCATLAVYWPVSRHPFIFLDDQPYVVHNSAITHLNWETVKWAFTTYRAANWHPVTWLSHALDYRLFGLDAGRHHETNLLLHVLNAVVLFWVLSQATGRRGRSFAVAALFALHPVNVESVAWVAERKNLLSMLFFLLALGAYYAYARKPQIGRYLIVAGLYALGLMSKPQIITLPFVLLLWDYWPLGRIASRSSLFAFRRSPQANRSGEERTTNSDERSWGMLVLEKLPLLALSAASAIVTVRAQHAGGTMAGVVNSFSLASRLGNALVAYVRYMGAAIWPTHLAFFYPHARTSPPGWQLAGSLALLIAITVFTLAHRSRRYLVVGWFWFLGTLIPMIGVVQVGSQAMADRYAYLPFVGLFLAVCWGVTDWAERWPVAKVLLPAGTGAILCLLALATRRQLSYWSDDVSLWTHTVQVTINNGFAENMIGEDLLRENNREAAIPHFRAAAVMRPSDPFPHLHVGIYEEEHGHPREAIQELNTVLDLTGPFAAHTPNIRRNALVYMSYAYNQLGDYANQKKYMDMAAQAQLP
jgi:protein O-mannosyl-transferase